MRPSDCPDPSEVGISQVSIDIDSYEPGWQWTALRAFHNAKDAGAVQIDVQISSSGSGIHIIAWFPELLTDAETQVMRETFADDSNRVSMDEERGSVRHTRQVLWTWKGDNRIDTDPEDVWHALETIERRIRAENPQSIPHGLVNHGRRALGRLAFPHRTPTPTPE